MRFGRVRTADELAALTEEVGFLPFFRCGVPGWSLEENIDPSVWFTEENGPWEWKGQLAREKRLVYAKLIRRKAAFVSLRWFPDLCNWRRDGYDFEGRCDDGLVPHADRLVMEYVQARGPVRSREVRQQCGAAKGFDIALGRLMMQTFIINRDFVYETDRFGQRYGWGVSLLDTPENLFGEELVNAAEGRTPAESQTRLIHHLCCCMPDVDEMLLRREMRV